MNRFSAIVLGALTLSAFTVLADLPVTGPYSEAWKDAFIEGATVEGKCFYKVGETMTFRLKLGGLAAVPKGDWKLRWKRTGDDGRTEEGTAPLPVGEPFFYRTSIAKPGFVRLFAEVPGTGANVKFDGGAGADFDRIVQEQGEPTDFDAFWKRELEALAKMPLDARIEEVKSPRPDVKLCRFTLGCTHGRPSTGFLSIPRKPGKYPVRLRFFGYNESWSPRATAFPTDKEAPPYEIVLRVNAHGLENGREAAYYAEARKAASSHGFGHGFDPAQNARPETCYFLGMILRNVRAAQFAKTLPEWDGKTIRAYGGSQGGAQALWVAALEPAVSDAEVFIPWMCDLRGKAFGGRQGTDWGPDYAPGLDYFDCVNFARRLRPNQYVNVFHAGLGDYICPPSGIASLYHALSCRKRLVWVQNCEHGWSAPAKGKQKAEFSAPCPSESSSCAHADRGADKSLSCRATHLGALYQPDETPAFDLAFMHADHGAVTPYDCRVFDWQDRLVLTRRLPAGPTARLQISAAELGCGFGAYRLVVTCGGLTNETGFARLTGPRPKPCGWVGTGVHDGHGWGKGDLRFLDILSEIGIGVVRDAPGWPDVEAEKGVYRVSENFDRFVDGLAARGIGFNMIMSRPNPAYANPLDPDAFARWCGYMAKRYGDRVRTWEIWNEPQHFGFRRHYGPSNEFWVAKFIELTRKADDAIRAVCPDANVAVTSEDEWWLLEKMLYGGIARPHNLVSFHSYCHGQPRPERALFFKDNGAKMRLRAANHGGVKRFALTESGWTTYQGKMKYLEIAGGYPRASLVQQAQYVVRMLILARQLGVEYACQYDFMNDGREPSFTEHNFGLVRADCSPKPALAAVAQLTRLVGEADPLGDLSDDPQRYRLYRFRQPSGDVYAAWAIEGQVEITLPDAVPEKTVCLDLMGNVVTRPQQGRRLTLDETPVFLKAAPDRDDTAMLQGLLDKGGEISLPARTYNISRKLLFRSSTHLRFADGARIVLLPRSDCMMAGNADPVAGNFDISIEGGVWDMDNLRQAPNPSWRHCCNPPKPRLKLPKTYDPSFYRGVAVYFENVSNLVVKGITIRNPVTYAFHLCRAAHFAVDNVTLDYTTENPIKGNMDGIHLDGGCHHGKISNIRGTCWDDMVAINANDVYCSACQGAITDIEIDGVESEYSHSAVRLLSAPDPVERIRIRNVRGHFFLYAIGFTHYFADKPCGTIRDVVIENVSAGLAPPPPDMWPMKNQPVLYFTKDVKVDGLRIDGFEILPNLPEVPDRWKLKPGMVPHRRP